MVPFFLTIAILLLLLNGFFVLAEFAAVKMRPSRVEELIDDGVRGAGSVQHVQHHLDEYLSVCQLGITFASIGLGFVAEPAIVRMILPILEWTGLFDTDSHGQWFTAHGIAFSISYLLVSFLHILVGELVPKSIAIRMTDRASLWTAAPLAIFRWIFYVPLKLLNASANALLKWMGLRDVGLESPHSEDELRILLSQSQTQGMMSFRRLLFLENVFDLGELRVKDAMRPRSQVRCLSVNQPWSENAQIVRKFRFSRYPLIDQAAEDPIGVLHLKDIFLADADEPDLRRYRRPILTVQEGAMLESLLSDMQRRRVHAAIVRDATGRWTGFLTLEDVIEEIIGTIRDEFEDEEVVHLADVLTEDRIQLGIEADSTVEAVRRAVERMKPESLPISKAQIVRAIEERERVVETYLGNGLGMPHARVPGITKPVVLFIRSEQGIPYRGTHERSHLLTVLLTPAGQPRVHQRLQAVVATIMDESEFIPDRLRSAESPAEILEILKTGEQAALD
jgi:CBS domain containing-hemolysin-like protein